jgi:hypothetical protein
MASTRDDETQDLAQFEPDPDGQGTVEQPLETAGTDGGADDPQWVVFPDPQGESDWANDELTKLTPGFHVR